MEIIKINNLTKDYGNPVFRSSHHESLEVYKVVI